MPDRLKQAIFNILGSRYATPGRLPALRVADVFAGSGSMGLEALSRGAIHCTFYENGRLALGCLRENIDALAAGTQCSVATMDAWTLAARETASGGYDLVFLDPPYRDSRDLSATGPVPTFLRRAVQALGRELPMIVWHHPARVAATQDHVPAPWMLVDQRVLGTSAVTFLSGPAAAGEEPCPT
jgi:16S rRNA (guanine966-N2)-methyltransferase